ncbi:MAG: phosphotransferase family protein [Gemmobacter sp.]
MTRAIPAHARDITPAWLSHALGRPVTAHTMARIGAERAFSGGEVWRITLADACTLIAKLPPAAPAPRAALAPANAREVAFYTRFAAPGLPVPQVPYAAADDAGSILLMQDLGPLTPMRLTDGCDPARAADALRALAAVHARWWNHADLATLQGPEFLAEFPFPALWPAFRARHPDLPAPLVALGDRLARHGPALMPNSGARTLIHRDPHLENLLFGAAPGGHRAAILDWQMAGQGHPAWDLCYFLASSLTPAVRRAAQDDLTAAYHAALTAHGVTGFTLAQCRHDLPRALAGKLYLTVVAAMTFDSAGPAKAAYRRADLDRLAAFATDHPDA